MLEHDSVPRVPPPAAGTPVRDFGPHGLQILTTEHWSLLAARSLAYTEAMSRASIFVAVALKTVARHQREIDALFPSPRAPNG